MSSQKLRGSNKITVASIAETLQLALDSASNENELRDYIKVVIKNCNKKPTGKPIRFGIYDLTSETWFHNNEFNMSWESKEEAERYEYEFLRLHPKFKTEVRPLTTKQNH